MKRFLQIMSLSLLNILSACGQQTYDQKLNNLYKKTVTLIQPQALDALMKSEEVVLLDTRAPAEYEVSHLKDAQFADYDNFKLADISAIDKNKSIVVYCSVGYRSERIGEKLLEAGYTKVYNLYGGIFQWKNKDYPIYNTSGEATDSVHVYNNRWGKWLEDGKGVKVTD